MAASESSSECDARLSERLFATDRYPVNRINVYSRTDTLTFLHDLLKDSPEFEAIRLSGFGSLFDLSALRCPISCKLIHCLLTRQVVSKRKYDMWIVFGGHPFHFGLKEFGSVTGLPCGEFPEEYDPEFEEPNTMVPDAYWKKLIGNDPKTTLADIPHLLKTEPDMRRKRRLHLALLLIVDGVLVVKSQVHKPTPKYVRMLEDLPGFLAFPLGRESFLKTIAGMPPGSKSPGKLEDPVVAYRQQMRQTTFRLVGFPLALQLVAIQAIPLLPSKLSNDGEHPTLLEWTEVKLRKSNALSHTDVLDVEFDNNLLVHPLIPLQENSVLATT